MRTIRISEDVWQVIAKNGKFGETEDDVLRRIFKLPDNPGSDMNQNISKNNIHSMRHTASGRRRSFATQKMSSYIDDNQLKVEFQNGVQDSWKLPDRNDKLEIRILIDKAMKFCDRNGASVGQKNAARKTLTSEGYHLTK